MQPKRRIDLMAAAASLERQGRYVSFAQRVRHLFAAESIQADLKEAEAYLDLCVEIASDDRETPPTEVQVQSEEGARIATALFSMAIVRYARATSQGRNDNRARKPIKILEGYSQTEREAHDCVLKVRDRGIAHMDQTTDLSDGPWHTEWLVLSEQDHPHLTRMYQFYFERTNYRKNLLDDLGTAVTAGLRSCDIILDTARMSVNNEIDRLIETYRDFEGRLHRHNFSAVAHSEDLYPTMTFLEHPSRERS